MEIGISMQKQNKNQQAEPLLAKVLIFTTDFQLLYNFAFHTVSKHSEMILTEKE